MKSKILLTLLLLLFVSAEAYAQSPILELRDDKYPPRKLFVYANGRYEMFVNPGETPLTGTAEFLKAPPDIISFDASGNDGAGNSYSFTVRGNRRDWTGTVTNGVRVQRGIAETFSITDNTKNAPPKK